MRDARLKNITNFRTAIAPFRNLWESVLIRSCWLETGDPNTVLYMHAWLDSREPTEIEPFVAFPNSKMVRAGEVVLPIAQLDDLLQCLADGAISIGDSRIKIRRYLGKGQPETWDDNFSFREYLDPKENGGDVPFVQLATDLGRIAAPYEGLVDMRRLVQSWVTSEPPYAGIEDVAARFLNLKGHVTRGEESVVYLTAPIPIRFSIPTPTQNNRLQIVLHAPSTCATDQVSVSRTVERHDGNMTRKKELFPKNLWASDGDGLKHAFEFDITRAKNIQLFLCYADEILEQRSISFPTPGSANPCLTSVEVFDPGLRCLIECLRSKNFGNLDDRKQDSASRRFEVAISWLLGFCGLRTFLLGKPAPLSSEVDVLAFSPESRIFLAAECTVGLPTNKDKLEKLYARSHAIRTAQGKGYRVWPIVFTATSKAGLAPTIIDAATRNEIAIAAQEDIQAILDMAQAGKPTRDILERLRGIMVPPDSNRFMSLFGRATGWTDPA